MDNEKTLCYQLDKLKLDTNSMQSQRALKTQTSIKVESVDPNPSEETMGTRKSARLAKKAIQH